jgi:hypothetical protein
VNARLNAWAMALRQTPGVVNTTAALVNPEPFNDGVARLHRTRSTGENPGIDISTALHRGFLRFSPSGVVAIPRDSSGRTGRGRNGRAIGAAFRALSSRTALTETHETLTRPAPAHQFERAQLDSSSSRRD